MFRSVQVDHRREIVLCLLLTSYVAVDRAKSACTVAAHSSYFAHSFLRMDIPPLVRMNTNLIPLFSNQSITLLLHHRLITPGSQSTRQG